MFDITEEPASSLLVTGSRVYTGISAAPWAEAVLCEGGLVRYVGTEAEARDLAPAGTEHVHIPAGLVTAGLNDSHLHTDYGAYDLTILSLEGVTDLSEMLDRIRAYAQVNPDREWIEGYGVFYEVWQGLAGPERLAIDSAVSDRPVFLKAFDGHSSWVNTEALRRSGIERGAGSPPPNVVITGDDGLATGMLTEGAAGFIERVMGEPTESEREEMLVNAIRYLNSLGITSVQNMKEDLGVLQRWQRVRERGALTLRAYHYLIVDESTPRDYLLDCKQYTEAFSDDWNRTSGIKLFMDGVVEAKTAWMHNPYADGSGDRGVPNITPEVFRDIVVAADALDMDVAVHAIGEQAVHHTLDSYQAAQEVNGGRRDRRHRVEHIETILTSDIARFGQLGVTASMQPLHAAPTSDPRFTPWTLLAGPEREPYSFPWRRLADGGAVLSFGSDWPVVTADVRPGLHAAVTRRSTSGEPAGGWQPQQCVTLEEALRAYTAGAAYAQRAERKKGRLRPGMFADLTIFDRDLFAVPPSEILQARIELTVVSGRVVYRRAELNAAVGA